MLKMFLDWPVLTILYAFCIVLVLIYIMCHLPDKWTDKKIFMGPFIFLCFSIMVVGVVSPILIYFSVKEPISNKAWKQVYTNNENASVEISFEEGCYQKKYSIKAGENSSDNIRKLYNKLNSDSVVYDVKITVSQGKNKLTKVVAITKDNFVRNKVDLLMSSSFALFATFSEQDPEGSTQLFDKLKEQNYPKETLLLKFLNEIDTDALDKNRYNANYNRAFELFRRIISKSPTKTERSVRKEFYDYFE